MSEQETTKRRKAPQTRRLFSVEGQLRGKLGNEGYDLLVGQLKARVSGRRRGRRAKS